MYALHTFYFGNQIYIYSWEQPNGFCLAHISGKTSRLSEYVTLEFLYFLRLFWISPSRWLERDSDVTIISQAQCVTRHRVAILIAKVERCDKGK